MKREDFGKLFEALSGRGYRIVGPRPEDGAIIYGEISSAQELPAGVRLEQEPGRVRLSRTQDSRCFAWANGTFALKPFLFSPEETLWRSRKEQDTLVFDEEKTPFPKTAFLGVRGCDVAALALSDAHFQDADAPYQRRREHLFLVAVHCSHPASTCFCVSTGDGPQAQGSYDMGLWELDGGFLIETKSDVGQAVLASLPTRPSTAEEKALAQKEIEASAQAQQRRLPSKNLRDFLFSSLEAKRWEEVAHRCLSCANCTSVCPTCFCFREEDAPDLEGDRAVHRRLWDSCFASEHSYIHGLVVRGHTRERYRQWLTHKLGGWHDQYGRSGCVGCGRCIAWCPVGIDLTEEVAALEQEVPPNTPA